MQAATPLKSLSISTRLGLGFGCMLMLVVAVAAVGQVSVGKVHEQMRLITGLGAQKSVLVNGMLESVSAMGIQSRSAAMLNDIDPKLGARADRRRGRNAQGLRAPGGGTGRAAGRGQRLGR